VAPGSPWEDGYVESFHDKLCDELLNRELFLHLDELRYMVDRWRMDYNHYRPHSSLGYMSPAAFEAGCLGSDSAPLRQPQDKDKASNSLIETGA
jgi:transposase InsO family protein